MKHKKYRRVIQYAKETSNLFASKYGNKLSRSLKITGAAVTASTLIAVGKLIMGIFSLSFFTCASSFYSFGMIGAKCIALLGIRKAKNKNEQYQYYLCSGVVLIVSSLLYIIYSIRLFRYPITSSYHLYVAIGIAAVTFAEIGLNIKGVIVTRHNHTLLIHSIKMINLSASLIALVLTQTALLSVTAEVDSIEISKANGVTGILMGTVAILLGSYMIYRAKRLKCSEYFLIED